MAFGLWTSKLSAEKSAEVANQFFNAIESGDFAKVADIFAADAEIWHNPDEVVVPPTTTLRTLKAMHKYIANIKYENKQVRSWPGGFVEQHVLSGVRKVDGGKVRLPACIVCEVNAEGKITRLDEYFDSAAQNLFSRPPAKAKM
ncbi:uncharacterized protein PV09_02318 [Verruconis gallopava]|uniref:SnoaL-like domain-containing protein n=1 Tax=Verruconis gallopava TaxID=253628 RepID=A0A0D2AIB1_9PEZI|nr:uncharacterized protein PV09_02318 [Verruconis gallopava]KIW06603.1 hypothetical protein PV09_02318 [Verruconis gallopava]